MEAISKAMEMMQKAMKEEYGEDAKLEDGDSITGVFNDGVMTMSLENGELKLDIKAGTPYKFDFDLNLVEKEEIKDEKES